MSEDQAGENSEEEIYRTGEDEAPAEAEERPEEEPEEEPAGSGLLGRVPEWVVALGAGCLLAATLITAFMAVFVSYLLVTDQLFGFARSRLMLGLVQFVVLTITQAVGVYLARKRMRWMFTMIFAIMGATALLTLPFSIPAVALLWLGKRHFQHSTPADAWEQE